MLQFMKSWFAPVHLSLEQAIEILEQHRTKDEEKKRERSVKSLASLRELLSLLTKQVKELGQASIPDEDHIDPSIKTRVLSQRVFFTQQITLFAEKMQKTSEQEFWEIFQQEWALLTQKTAKSAVFVNHLFYHELSSLKETMLHITQLGEEYTAQFSGDDLFQILHDINAQKEMRTAYKEKIQELSVRTEDIKHHIKKIQELRSSLDIPLEKEWDLCQSQERELREKGETFLAKTRRLWEKLAKKIPEQEKAIRRFLAESWEENEYMHLHSFLLSAIENKQLGNEEYSKIQKIVEEWDSDHFIVFCRELHAIKKKKETYVASLSPYWEKMEKYKQELLHLEEEGNMLEKEKEKITKELQSIPSLDTKKLSSFASQLLQKKVVIDA